MNNIDLSDLPPEVLNSVTPERRRELEEYAQHRGTTLTRNQEEKWDKEVSKIPFDWNNPPTKPSADDEEIDKEAARIYFLKPKTPAEFVYFTTVQLNLEQEARQHQENESNRTIALIAEDIVSKQMGETVTKHTTENARKGGLAKATVKNKGDRCKICTEVNRLVANGETRNSACVQVATQASNGHVGANGTKHYHKLTEPYYSISRYCVLRLSKPKTD